MGITIRLPRRPDRDDLSGFGLALTILVGITALIAVLLFDVLSVAVAAGVAAAGLLSVSLAAPSRLDLPYRAWNRLGHEYSRFARFVILTLGYFSTFPVAARRHEAFVSSAVGEDDRSGWQARTTLPPAVYSSEDRVPADGDGSTWSVRFLAWCARAGRIGLMGLLPYLAILRAFGSREPGEAPRDIYTLY